MSNQDFTKMRKEKLSINLVEKRKTRSEPNRRRSGAPKGNKNALGNSGQQPQIYTDEWINNEAKLFREWLNKPDSLFFTTFATDRGYCIQRLTEFANRSLEFAEVLKFAKDWQANRLVNGGLKNETNASITKFVLANHHNYTEKQQITGDSNNPVSFLMTKHDGSSKDLVDDNKEPA